MMSAEEIDRLRMLNVETYGPETRWSHQTALKGMDTYNATTKRIAEARDVFLIDLEKALPKSLDYFYDDVHYTEKSFDIIANFIATEFTRQGIIDIKE